MSKFYACPRCGRKAESGLTHNWFPVYTCLKCGEKYCTECGSDGGDACPECGATKRGKYGEVYAKE